MSISIYRTGSDRGDTGPTGFLPDGKKLHLGYTDDYLIKHGAADESKIATTNNG